METNSPSTFSPIESPSFSEQQLKSAQASFITNVYSWMSIALLITGLVAVWTANSPETIMFIYGNKFVFYGLLISEVLLVGFISARIKKMASQTAIALYVLYAALSGLTLAFIFLLFTAESIASTFFICAGTFGAMSAYGYFTKRDLTTIGNLAMMALFGLIIASIVNIFWSNELLYWITTYAGVLIFVGLTAYDTQKLKRMFSEGVVDEEQEKKLALMGGLTLYLDFINLFLFLLRIFGRRK